MNMQVIYYNLNKIFNRNEFLGPNVFVFIWENLKVTIIYQNNNTSVITMKPTLPFLIIKAMQIIYLKNPRPSLISPHHLKGDLTKSDKCNQFYEELED